MEEKKNKLLIRYPQRRGFILEAHKLQQQIRAHFNVSVEVEEHAEGSLSLLLEGAPIYSKYFADCARIPYDKILLAVSEYAQPLPKIGEAVGETDNESGVDDPDHRHWLNSVCSGD
jgi:hypothetical protein